MFTYINGKFTELKPMKELFDQVIYYFEQQQKENERLREANTALKSEQYAKDEVSRMKSEYDRMRKDYFRGFPISKAEDEAIAVWQTAHTEKIHKATTSRQKLALEGASGGRWSYVFVPTSLGVSGVCRCDSCYSKMMDKYREYLKKEHKNYDYGVLKEMREVFDVEFEFQEIG